MVEASGKKILPGVVVKKSPVVLKLVHKIVVDCRLLCSWKSRKRAGRQRALQRSGAERSRNHGLPVETVDRSKPLSIQRIDHCLLRRSGPKRGRIQQQRNRILGILSQPLKREESERLVFLDRESHVR